MAAEIDNPLTDEHLDALKALQARMVKTRAYLERCSRCGIDVEEEKAKNAQCCDVAENVRREFFPDR